MSLLCSPQRARAESPSLLGSLWIFIDTPYFRHLVFLWGWENGLSPFSILRSIGPWGPLLVGKYSSRRFASQSDEDVRDLHSYIYNTSVMKGSGEFCICTRSFPVRSGH